MIASLPSTDSSTTQRSTRTPCASTRLRVASGRVAFALLLMLSIWLPAPAMAQTCTVTMADVNFGNVDATQATPHRRHGHDESDLFRLCDAVRAGVREPRRTGRQLGCPRDEGP